MGTLYDLVGGDQWFVDLVDRFYERVAEDELLKSMYPEDLTAPKAHLAGFLIQYWGGPADYSEQRGHPRLRMRHVPFEIGQAERDAWFDNMNAALEEGGLDPEVEEQVRAYFRNAADHLRNA
ncbi:MAG TPA: globin [Acidimicrobiales bacterium]|nr:globin [Acidimicrobiales bacterium]